MLIFISQFVEFFPKGGGMYPGRWLVVDDLRIVGDVSYFKDQPDDVVHVETCAEAQSLLTHCAFDILWLDHDLGPAGTIMPLVDWLSEQAHAGTPVQLERIIVHSANPVGAKAMVQTLERYGYNVHRGSLPN